VRALHGQSLFDRFNEPAPAFIDTSHHGLSHSTTSLSAGRRVHTIPIRIEGTTVTLCHARNVSDSSRLSVPLLTTRAAGND